MEIWNLLTQLVHQLFELIIHLDQTLAVWSQWMGPWLYVVLFLIIFAETGLVVTPFLPGDSLLFAVGALTALPETGLRVELMAPLLMLAALLGDNTNYFFGKWIGKHIATNRLKLVNQKHLDSTQGFYVKHGPRAIVIGRFMPIARTFVPFVAGVGQMKYKTYIGYSLLGAVLWINSFLWAGHYFGNLPSIKSNFHIVIFAVILVSMLPLVYELWKAKRSTSRPTS